MLPTPHSAAPPLLRLFKGNATTNKQNGSTNRIHELSRRYKLLNGEIKTNFSLPLSRRTNDTAPTLVGPAVSAVRCIREKYLFILIKIKNKNQLTACNNVLISGIEGNQ